MDRLGERSTLHGPLDEVARCWRWQPDIGMRPMNRNQAMLTRGDRKGSGKAGEVFGNNGHIRRDSATVLLEMTNEELDVPFGNIEIKKYRQYINILMELPTPSEAQCPSTNIGLLLLSRQQRNLNNEHTSLRYRPLASLIVNRDVVRLPRLLHYKQMGAAEF
jgi:hypothetical protein